MKTKGLKNSINPSIKELERFYSFLNSRFKLQLPDELTVTIQSKGRMNAYGWFSGQRWVNGNGRVSEINLSAELLTENDPYKTMAHEVGHYYNYVNGIRDCSGNQYHNKRFKEVAERLLLETSYNKKTGYSTTTPTEEFKKMLSEFKPQKDVFNLFRDMPKAKKQKTKMVKWVCPQCGLIVRSAKELNIMCLDCDAVFTRG